MSSLVATKQMVVHLTLPWVESNNLKFNVDTTDLIIIGIKQQRNKIVDYSPVKLRGNDASPSDTVRNLGVVFDSDFGFHQYISQV